MESQIPSTREHPHARYKHSLSRRYACDRCRGHKLRCDRDLTSPIDKPCHRCERARAECTITSSLRTAQLHEIHGSKDSSDRPETENAGGISHQTDRVSPRNPHLQFIADTILQPLAKLIRQHRAKHQHSIPKWMVLETRPLVLLVVFQ